MKEMFDSLKNIVIPYGIIPQKLFDMGLLSKTNKKNKQLKKW